MATKLEKIFSNFIATVILSLCAFMLVGSFYIHFFGDDDASETTEARSSKIDTAAIASAKVRHKRTAAPERRTSQILGWMEKGRHAARQKLKDPDSAKFRNVFFSESPEGIPATCGEINARNGFGGYTGFQRFISMGNVEMTHFAEEVSDFHNLWSRLCTYPTSR